MERISKSRVCMIVRERFPEAVLALFTGMILLTCFKETINYDEYFSMSWCRLAWGGDFGRPLPVTYILPCIMSF